MAIVTTFADPGTDDTFDLTKYAAVSGGVSSATDAAFTGTHSLKCDTSSPATLARATTPAGKLLDSGSYVSFDFRTNSWAASATAAFVAFVTSGLSAVYSLVLGTDGKLINAPTGATAATGTTVLAINTWYRICISYYITNTTTFQFKVYVQDLSTGTVVLDSTANAGTLTRTGGDTLRLMAPSQYGANVLHWFDNVYVATGGASSSSQPDTGDVRMTAKLPFANGTANGFTGTGTPSGYGTGNAGYVNERPLSVSNFVSVVAAGVTTEEYNVEEPTVGDQSVNIYRIVDVCGWIYAKSLLSETASLVLNGAASNVALTSTATRFDAFAGSTSYPAGTGTDIGLTTTGLATTVTLYECGIIVIYIPVSPAVLIGQFRQRGQA